ncbi:glycosyltransferase family 9 protein [Lacinutrix sp.]|uniref:glycosyltransferase family 9 protein n=1 Tax=Lacinutrix sp. TaxID=1937692 RepID=UPI0025C5D236|nr:glycosyltransferase family 9 protein [Lacinutrix sp.]
MKILVIQQKMIGDVLTSSILFEALRAKYPEAQLDYLINSHTLAVVENNTNIDNFILFTKQEENSKRALLRFAKSLKHKKYDVIIDVYSILSSNIITLFSKAKIKISYYKYYTTFIYHYNIKRQTKTETKSGLAIVNRLQLLKPLGIDITEAKPKIHLTKEEITSSKQFLKNQGIDFKKPLYMISVLGSGTNKTYPFAFMAKVIDTIAKQTGGQLLFNYIPNQKEQAQAIYNLCRPETQKLIFFDIFGKNLREFLAITKHCTALIGNEGGAINMAKALDVKTFAIFSPWISKDAWSLFEDNKQNVSVHLKDFKPEFYNNKNEKDIKKDALALYQEFSPSFFDKKLNVFLQQTTNL